LPDNTQQNKWSLEWVFLPLLLCFISLFFSRFLLSVGVGLMLLVLIYTKFQLKKKILQSQPRLVKWMFYILVIWVTMVLLDGFRSQPNVWLNEVLLKLPLLIIPLYVFLLPKNTCSFRNTWLIFTIITSLVALVSTIHYWFNFEEINALLLQSKHVPIFGNMHHIYFGVIMSLCIWVCIYYFKTDRYKTIWITCGVAMTLMLHILASRTGLVAFYASSIVFVILYALQSQRYKLLMVGLICILFLPLLAYQLSGSFRNKIANSTEDFKAVKSGEDINYKSLAMRIEAWKTSAHIVKKNPIFGVGAPNVNREIQHQYRLDKTVLYPENRVGPHNQFLELTLAYGWIGGLLLTFLSVLWAIVTIKNPAVAAMSAVLILSLFLESFLERQQGILVFCVFLFSFIPLPSKVKKETKD
jgi:O-antigen ligase